MIQCYPSCFCCGCDLRFGVMSFLRKIKRVRSHMCTKRQLLQRTSYAHVLLFFTGIIASEEPPNERRGRAIWDVAATSEAGRVMRMRHQTTE